MYLCLVVASSCLEQTLQHYIQVLIVECPARVHSREHLLCSRVFGQVKPHVCWLLLCTIYNIPWYESNQGIIDNSILSIPPPFIIHEVQTLRRRRGYYGAEIKSIINNSKFMMSIVVISINININCRKSIEEWWSSHLSTSHVFFLNPT